MITKNELIYLASPLTHTSDDVMEDRFDDICEIASYFINDCKLNIFSPIAHSWPIQKFATVNTSFDYWKDYCFLLVSKCDYVIVAMMDGWKESVGVQAEIEYAKELGLPVYYFDTVTCRLHKTEV